MSVAPTAGGGNLRGMDNMDYPPLDEILPEQSEGVDPAVPRWQAGEPVDSDDFKLWMYSTQGPTGTFIDESGVRWRVENGRIVERLDP